MTAVGAAAITAMCVAALFIAVALERRDARRCAGRYADTDVSTSAATATDGARTGAA